MSSQECNLTFHRVLEIASSSKNDILPLVFASNFVTPITNVSVENLFFIVHYLETTFQSWLRKSNKFTHFTNGLAQRGIPESNENEKILNPEVSRV